MWNSKVPTHANKHINGLHVTSDVHWEKRDKGRDPHDYNIYQYFSPLLKKKGQTCPMGEER